MFTRLRGARFYFAVSLFLFAIPARASILPTVYYEAANLGGGLFNYQLAVVNTHGTYDYNGLIVTFGNSVFGLSNGSVVGSPTNWSDFLPIPPFVDSLDFFSTDPTSASDIPFNGALGGFSFQSTTDPSTLAPGNFDVQLVIDGAGIVDLGSPVAAPEPRFTILSAMLLAAWLARRPILRLRRQLLL